MFNMMKADLYRVLRSKMFYITLGFLFLLIGLQIFNWYNIKFNDATRAAWDTWMRLNPNPTTPPPVNIDMPSFPIGSFETFTHMMNEIYYLLFFMLPPIILFTCTDFSQGTMQNTLAHGISRTKIYFAKLIETIIVGFIFGVIYLLVPTLFYSVFFGVDFGAFSVFFTYMLPQILLAGLMLGTIVCIGTCLAFLTKKMVGTIGASVAFIMIPTVLISASANLSKDLSNFLKHFDMGSIITYGSQYRDWDQFYMFVLLAGYIVLSTVLGILVFRRSDIKK